jgi:hypothetical protein
MSVRLHQLSVSAKANLRSKLSAQRGRSQNLRKDEGVRGMSVRLHQLSVSVKANLRSKLNAQRGRDQNRQIKKGYAV